VVDLALPLNITEKPKFKKMFEVSNPDLIVPTKYLLNAEIEHMHINYKKEQTNTLDNVKYLVGTLDLWTSWRKYDQISHSIAHNFRIKLFLICNCLFQIFYGCYYRMD
jgi:hypothetical protein